MLVPEFRAYHRGEMKEVLWISLNHNDLGFQNGITAYYRGSLKDCELSQCLGILDKHRNKVFEGDVVDAFVTDNKGITYSYRGVVCVEEYEVVLETDDSLWPVISWSLVDHFVVVGNRWQLC